jgi:hypothetical protein
VPLLMIPFDATKPEFCPIYDEIAALPDLEPDAHLDTIVFAFEADKKIGPHISAAQV